VTTSSPTISNEADEKSIEELVDYIQGKPPVTTHESSPDKPELKTPKKRRKRKNRRKTTEEPEQEPEDPEMDEMTEFKRKIENVNVSKNRIKPNISEEWVKNLSARLTEYKN